MNALISGRSRRALLIDGDSLKSFDVDNPSTIVPRSRTDLQFIFGDASDLRVIQNATKETIEHELKADSNLTLALDLVLISLDLELTDKTRKQALQQLAQLLKDDSVHLYLANILYSHSVPEDGDLDGALKLCDERSLGLKRFLQRLKDHQPLISTVARCWNLVPAKLFAGHENRDEFRRAAVRTGFFRALVHCQDQKTLRAFESGAIESIRHLPNLVLVLRKWISLYIKHGMALNAEQSENARAGERNENDAKARRRSKTKRSFDGRLAQLIDEMLEGHILLDEAISSFEKMYIKKALARHRAHLTSTAVALGIKRTTLAERVAWYEKQKQTSNRAPLRTQNRQRS